MSKQIGIIKLDGAIGGIAFYQAGGQHLARVAKGPTKQQIATQPNFIRTRENNAEFGGSANTAKAMRTALAGSVQTMGDSRITSRLTKLFREICSKDDQSPRGQRRVQLSQNMSSLVGFQFNKAQSFDSVFAAPYTITTDPARNKADIEVLPFLPANSIHAPAGATHFSLKAAMGAVSDYAYLTNLQAYEALEPEQNGLSAVHATNNAPVDNTQPLTFTLSTEFTTGPAITNTTSVILCLGIEFYQRVGTVDYLFAQGNAMKVIAVF